MLERPMPMGRNLVVGGKLTRKVNGTASFGGPSITATFAPGVGLGVFPFEISLVHGIRLRAYFVYVTGKSLIIT
jgi:hypothetical protein